jgi:hypothetical protein
MALLDDALKGWGGVAVGFGTAFVVPTIGTAASLTLRPLAKAIIKGVLYASGWVKEIASEASEQVNDLVAEVRAETRRETRARVARHS